jgi:hypothetical protein
MTAGLGKRGRPTTAASGIPIRKELTCIELIEITLIAREHVFKQALVNRRISQLKPLALPIDQKLATLAAGRRGQIGKLEHFEY